MGSAQTNLLLKKKTLRLETVQKSDSGSYQVIATDGKKIVTSNFTLVVQDKTSITSTVPYPTTSQTEPSRPNPKRNAAKAGNAISSQHPDSTTTTLTITTNSLQDPDSTTTTPTTSKHSNGLQEWLIGIIIVIILLAILLAIAIPTACVSYKLRLFCFSLCNSNRDSDKGRQTSNPVYMNATYDTVHIFKATAAANSNSMEVTISTFRDADVSTADHTPTYSNMASTLTQDTSNVLPDIITATETNNTATVNVREETMPLPTVVDAGKESDGTGPMVIYASVNKEKKSTSETPQPTKTKEPASATFSEKELGNTINIPTYATVSLKRTDAHKTDDLPDNGSFNEHESGQRHTRNDERLPRRPAPYKVSTPKGQSLAEEKNDTKPAIKTAAYKKKEDDRSTVYAALSTPAPMEVQHKSPDDRAVNAANKPCTIPYVELDIDALTKKM